MNQPVVFVDVETISLKRDYRHVWEIGLLDPTEGFERTWQVRGLPLGEADSKALGIGRFYDRYEFADAEHRSDIADEFEEYTRGKTLVGANTGFDEMRLYQFLVSQDRCPAWHYRIIDIEDLVVGYLRAQGEHVEVPWKSDIIARQIGVYSEQFDRHTAIGDCYWTQAQWDVVMG